MSLKDGRVEHLNKFARGIADLQMLRNPLSSEVIVIFNEVQLDQYQDSVTIETHRVKKQAMVKKNPDMNYVQELGDVLLEDNLEQVPWIISMTTTGLDRVPRMNDQLMIEGIKYTIAMVKPANRNLSSLINLIIYPERTLPQDSLNIYDVNVIYRGKIIKSIYEAFDQVVVLDITYGGLPKYYSFDNKSWLPFQSRIKLLVNATNQYKQPQKPLFGGSADPDYVLNIAALYPKVVFGGSASSNQDTTIDGGTSTTGLIKLFLKDAENNICVKEL